MKTNDPNVISSAANRVNQPYAALGAGLSGKQGISVISGLNAFSKTNMIPFICRTPYYFKVLPFLLLLMVIISPGCLSPVKSTYNLEKNIGLYRIVDKNCQLKDDGHNPCEYTHYIELVKGHFYGIDDSELALVFWTGDLTIPEEKEDLTYTAIKISDHRTLPFSDNTIWLTNEDISNRSESEYFLVDGSRLTEFNYIHKTNGQIRRKLHYKLERINNDRSIRYKLKYPNDNLEHTEQ